MGCSATTASRKMIVRAARRIVSAISFGVFCRSAPSTRAIIRSTNDSPGAAVICTTMRSDSTVVPPVTELRSPPDSRITGADSPVMADSSTVAMPSTMSPSPGTTCPASTTTRSPTFRVVPGTSSSETSFRSRRATVSVRVRRRLSAWALPRPSATASARFANRTVNHSQTAISQEKTLGSATASPVTRTEPTQTTNMTGLRSWVRGSSLRSASGRERHSWPAENAPPPTARRVCVAACGRSRVRVLMRVPPRSARGPVQGRR